MKTHPNVMSVVSHRWSNRRAEGFSHPAKNRILGKLLNPCNVLVWFYFYFRNQMFWASVLVDVIVVTFQYQIIPLRMYVIGPGPFWALISPTKHFKNTHLTCSWFHETTTWKVKHDAFFFSNILSHLWHFQNVTSPNPMSIYDLGFSCFCSFS